MQALFDSYLNLQKNDEKVEPEEDKAKRRAVTRSVVVHMNLLGPTGDGGSPTPSG